MWLFVLSCVCVCFNDSVCILCVMQCSFVCCTLWLCILGHRRWFPVWEPPARCSTSLKTKWRSTVLTHTSASILPMLTTSITTSPWAWSVAHVAFFAFLLLLPPNLSLCSVMCYLFFQSIFSMLWVICFITSRRGGGPLDFVCFVLTFHFFLFLFRFNFSYLF